MASAAAVLLAAAVVIAWVALTGDRGGEIETIPSAEQVVVAAETSVTDTAEPIGAAGVMQVDCDGGPVSRLSEVDTAALVPGDRLELKRGCTFTDTLLIAASGTADQPIVLSSFGDPADAAPVITSDVTGALIDLVGSNIDVRDLTLIAAPSDFLPGCEATPSGWTVGIQMGPRSSGNRVENVSISGAHAGVFIDKNASDHVIVANRFDSNTMMNDISGAFGVQIFGDRNLVSGNRFSNHATCHPNYGLEAGAAINIFDGSGNVISDNVSHDDRSFLYINGRADQNPVNNVIERNIIDSDHPESVFVSTDAESVVGGQNRIFHNTAVLRGASAVGLWCGRCSADEIVFANNIVWAATGTSRNASSATYSGGANLFWSDDASPRLASMELTGAPEIVEDPRFVDVNADAFELRACSPALSAARAVDESAAVETLGDGADIGALESGELRCQ